MSSWFAIFFIREKRKPTSCFSTIFFIQSYIIFQGRVRFDSWCVQKSDICFWNLCQKDVSDSIPERWCVVDLMIVGVEHIMVCVFLYSRKVKNQLFFWAQLFSLNHTLFLQGRFRFDSWRVQKSDIWNLFGKDVSGSIPERWFWLMKW